MLYGAAEFSRDIDLALQLEPENLARLQQLLEELQAECIAVPPFELEVLERGHAVHFRCRHPDAPNVRIDLMSKMRGVEPFARLWDRRTTYPGSDRIDYDLMGLPDLVAAKKTQRDKDWPMIRRLVEASYFSARSDHSPEVMTFWLRELRTPEILVELAMSQPDAAGELVPERRLLQSAIAGDLTEVVRRLANEEQIEREVDRQYWAPLKKELEMLRRAERVP